MLEQVEQGKIDLAVGVSHAACGSAAMCCLKKPSPACSIVIRCRTMACLTWTKLPGPSAPVGVDGWQHPGRSGQRVARSRVAAPGCGQCPALGHGSGMIAGTDLILTVATRTLDNLSFGDSLIALAPPMSVRSTMCRSGIRGSTNPAHRWLRDRVRRVVRH